MHKVIKVRKGPNVRDKMWVTEGRDEKMQRKGGIQQKNLKSE